MFLCVLRVLSRPCASAIEGRRPNHECNEHRLWPKSLTGHPSRGPASSRTRNTELQQLASIAGKVDRMIPAPAGLKLYRTIARQNDQLHSRRYQRQSCQGVRPLSWPITAP
eukprot:1656345-Pyramimonas_sp.AAC.2